MPENLVSRFQELLDSGQADVFTFLSSHSGSTIDDMLAVVLFDQQRRWAAGDELSVEEYWERLPALAQNARAVYELAAAQWKAENGDATVPEFLELKRRFPQLAALNTGDGTGTVVAPLTTPMTSDDFRTRSFQSDSTEKVLQSRYRIVRSLGKGNFGQVFLAFDIDLERQVAIKVPLAERFQQPGDAESYLAEAKTVAGLHHPHIVPVYDMGRTADGALFVVSRFIDGQTLEQFVLDEPLEVRTIAEWIKIVAEALHYAHMQRIIHRDVKPANILVELATHKPFVTDFGLAMREQDYATVRGGGTPAYMSPEQTRGEGHRLDGRSDVFALGIILYELLTGKRPFHGATVNEMLHQIVSVEPPPPSSIKYGIPPELERICLRAISKRISDRFDSAAEMAADLDAWLTEKREIVGDGSVATIHPKGLRSFDAGDADFFLDLLPGLRNREGLPDSIAFWKSRIEETDSVMAFRIGLIYGPSGCGKSSLVKAGLLPRISSSIQTIYVEATPDETEARILRAVRKLYPDMPEDETLAETLAAIRRAAGRKLTIIIDQFEQWLHTHEHNASSDLVQGLLQCDGAHVQTILMVRDDFAMAAARLMRVLDVRIVQGENFATVDLFDVDHARNVLNKFGQAFGKLPADLTQLSESEKKFIAKVIDGLAVNGKIVSVQLSLFAEMVKSKPWSVQTLEEVGGTQGIGANFLEETFGSSSANPEHRMHATAARSVLKALLPEVATDIKGHMRSHRELLEVSGYRARPAEFQDLLRILDGELRLITPTNPEGHGSQSGNDQDRQFSQLTHDYLVPALREWLTRKQRETPRGRAELKLDERTAQWHAKPESKQLPSLVEWLSIRRWTKPKQWTTSQRAMLQRADRMHVTRGVVTAVSACLILAIGLFVRSSVHQRQNEIEAKRLVEGLLAADTAQLESGLIQLSPFRLWADPLLRLAFKRSDDQSNAKLHAALSLVVGDHQPDAQSLAYLKSRYLQLSPLQLAPVRKLLEKHKGSISTDYCEIALDTSRPAHERFHAGCALAALDPDHATWSDSNWTDFVADQLVTVSPSYLSQYQELLKPVHKRLLAPLSTVFKDARRSEMARSFATTLLSDYAAEAADVLANLVVAAEPASDKQLFPILKEKHREWAVKKFESLLATELKPDWQDPLLDSSWKPPSPSMKAAIEQAGGTLEERFAFCQSMPLAGFHEMAESMRSCGYAPTRVRPWLDGQQAKVAAVWERHGRAWKLEIVSKRSELPVDHAPAAKDGMLLADVSRLPTLSASAPTHWLALWVASTDTSEERRVVIDGTTGDIGHAAEQLAGKGFVSQQSLTVANNAQGERIYSGIWSNRGAASEIELAYDGAEYIYPPQWDVDIASPEARVAALWLADTNVTSRCIELAGSQGSISQLHDLLAKGYRPRSIAVETGGSRLLLHLPNIPDAAKEQLAIDQAAAAAALMRLEASDKVWPWLDDRPDPRMRSYLMDRLAKVSVDAVTLVKQLAVESNSARQRSLILGLGELARAEMLSDRQQTELVTDFSKRYANDPDCGVHGASEWALRQLKADDKIAEIQAAMATGKPLGERRWYLSHVNGMGSASPITMMILNADEAFSMGSPVSESERFGGPTSRNEILHRREIGRQFAISSHEITVAQFQAFRPRHEFNRSYSREPDAPANRITWYDAAAYCNWLSEQAGIPRDQWCYDPQQKFEEGMTLPKDYLQRTGYRLPSEAEWEFACRAGTVTARYYGETERLFGQYAWYTKLSGDKFTLPVGSLRPNAAGLFDMLGNINEWTQDEPLRYPKGNADDTEKLAKLSNSEYRVLRGGSFFSDAPFVRSAYRFTYQPFNRNLYLGFRLSRTYH